MSSSANTNHCSCGAIKVAVYAVCPACLTAINRVEIAALRAENERLERSLNAAYINLSHSSRVSLEQQARGDHWELKCKGLLAEIARLTPTATRELPQVAGWYWMKRGSAEVEPIGIYEFCGKLRVRGMDRQWGYVDEAPSDVLWSTEPIPEMVVPDGQDGTSLLDAARHGPGHDIY